MSLASNAVKWANALLPAEWKIFRVSKDTGMPIVKWRWAPNEPQVNDTRYHYLGPDLALCLLKNGMYIYIDPQDYSIASHLITRGYWENWVYAVTCNIVKPGDHIVEVGANFGYYTLAMARDVGPSGSIVSFEANPDLTPLLSRSLIFNELQSRVTLVTKAASNQNGVTTFAISRRNAGGGATAVNAQQDDQRLIEVETVRLDDAVAISPRILRLDAEGSEVLILRGAERMLHRPDVVVCMEWDVLQMASRGDVPELVDWLNAMGFKFWRIGYDSDLIPVDHIEMASLAHCDVVMARNHPYLAS